MLSRSRRIFDIRVRRIVHLLKMYNSKQPHPCYEILLYGYYSYNKTLHNSNGAFQVCLGFQPLTLIDKGFPIASTEEEPSCDQKEENIVAKFVEHPKTYSNKFMIFLRSQVPQSKPSSTPI